MKDEIIKLEALSRLLDPNENTRTNWLGEVEAYSNAFLNSIEDSKAYNTTGSPEVIDDIPFDETAKPLRDILEILKDSVDTAGINPASGGHLGYIPGGGIYPSALGDFLADITNRYAGIYFANPGAVRVENKLIRWLADLIGYPGDAHGNLTSGGSIANLIGITSARDAKGIKAAVVERSVIYINPQTHHCVHKAIRIAGLGECVLREVALDSAYRMDPESLREQVQKDIDHGLRPFMVVASIGSTDTGAVDPIDAIADVCDEFDLWLQVDAAYGGFFILVDELRHHFKGVERSHSFIIDPHKGLFLPYGLGIVLVRDRGDLLRSHFYKANYMQDAYEDVNEISPADVSPELTKHFRGLRMWLPMQLLGLKPFRAALEEKWRLAQYFHREIQNLGFEVGPEPELSVLIYRYSLPDGDDNTFNKALIEAVRADGRLFISSTLIDGVFWLRLAVLSFRTHMREIDMLLEVLESKRDRLMESMVAGQLR